MKEIFEPPPGIHHTPVLLTVRGPLALSSAPDELTTVLHVAVFVVQGAHTGEVVSVPVAAVGDLSAAEE